MIAYTQNINNKYDLDNYLQYKQINIGDCIRAIWYLVYKKIGLTNNYRFDHFLAKPDIFY